MSNGNSVTVVGNATRDPELRFTPSGSAMAAFGIAVNRRWQNRQTQEWEEAVSFFDVQTWGALAENCAQSITKGTRVIVAGRLEQRSWENQEGERRSKIEIVADEVAPSLRYATVEVHKNERDESAQSSQQPQSSQTRPSSRRRPAQTEEYDEEPF